MADSSLLPDVLALLHDRLESYEQLEILLLLRTRSSEPWVPRLVAIELHMPEAIAEHSLRALSRQGLLSVAVSADTLTFRYRPESPELVVLVEKLAEAYTTHRIEVIRLMTANSIERLRARALRTFANAFLVGKRGRKDG